MVDVDPMLSADMHENLRLLLVSLRRHFGQQQPHPSHHPLTDREGPQSHFGRGCREGQSHHLPLPRV